jgi:hypothetical protein
MKDVAVDGALCTLHAGDGRAPRLGVVTADFYHDKVAREEPAELSHVKLGRSVGSTLPAVAPNARTRSFGKLQEAGIL